LIFLNNVAKIFEGRPLFEDVNIGIHRGDRIGIVGPNGAGKSTILGIMEGVVTPDQGEVSIEKRMRVGVLRQELVQGSDKPILDEVMNITDDLRQIQERLAELEQEMTHLSEDSDRVDAVLEEHGRLQHELETYGGYSLEARALKVLNGLGFGPEDVHRLWSQFSGGWRMRVALAKILLAEPDALLLDEPTNHLDLESLLWVEEFLGGFQGAMVLVSHDRAFLNKLVNKIIEVDRGKVAVYSGNYDEYEKNKRMQEEITFAAYRGQQEKIKRIQKFIDQNRVKARTASRVQSRVKMLDKMDRIEPPSKSRTVKFNFPQPSRTGRRVVEINGLVKRFGPKTVYEGFDFAVERGDRVAFVGPNGAGKSTLIKIIAGVLPYEGGSVKYGHLVKPGYFAQHQYENLNPERTVLDEAAAPAQGVTENEVRSLLGSFLFSGDDVYKKVKVLSGGEKSRLALAKILLSPPNLLLMDEPTNHLDIPSCEILEQALKKFEGTLLLITHDRRLMNEICTGILEITAQGTEFYPGNYEDYQYKKRLMTGVKEPPTKAGEPPIKETEPVSASSNTENRKQRKRSEAETRNALFKQKAPILEEIKGLERDLAGKEERRKTIQALLADPENYRNKEIIVPLLEEEPLVAKGIKELEARWEELHRRLDEIEKQALTG
jgi:ATP-binding cassette, subfamily F, member 3